MGPLLREDQAQADRERRLPQSSVRALESIRAFSISTPLQYGGFGAGARMLVDVAREIGRWSASAAWLTVVSNGSAMIATRFPDSAVARVFADGPPRMASIAPPPSQPQLEPEGDGARVSGRWPYASNIHHSAWAWGSIAGGPTAEAEPQVALFSRDDWTVEETWFTVGLRGTGSDTMVVHDAWLPADQLSPVARMIEFESDAAQPLSRRMAAISTLIATIAAPTVGVAQTALELVTEAAGTRGVTGSTYALRADSRAHVRDLGWIANQISTAILHLDQAADMIDDAASAAVALSPEARAQIRGDVAQIGRSIGGAIDAVIWCGGSSAFAEASMLSRLWRDVNIAIRHAGAAAPINRYSATVSSAEIRWSDSCEARRGAGRPSERCPGG